MSSPRTVQECHLRHHCVSLSFQACQDWDLMSLLTWMVSLSVLPHRADLARLSSRTAARSAHEIRRIGSGSGLHLCIICNLVSHGQDLLRWSSHSPCKWCLIAFLDCVVGHSLSDSILFHSHLLIFFGGGDPRTSLLYSVISSRGAPRMEVLIFRVLSSASCSDLPVRIDHGVPRSASNMCVSCLSGGGNLRIVLAKNVLSLVPVTCMSDLPSRPSQILNPHEDVDVQLDPSGSLHIRVSPKGNICPPTVALPMSERTLSGESCRV